jgi:hypothetical protein
MGAGTHRRQEQSETMRAGYTTSGDHERDRDLRAAFPEAAAIGQTFFDFITNSLVEVPETRIVSADVSHGMGAHWSQVLGANPGSANWRVRVAARALLRDHFVKVTNRGRTLPVFTRLLYELQAMKSTRTVLAAHALVVQMEYLGRTEWLKSLVPPMHGDGLCDLSIIKLRAQIEHYCDSKGKTIEELQAPTPAGNSEEAEEVQVQVDVEDGDNEGSESELDEDGMLGIIARLSQELSQSQQHVSQP